LINLTIYTNGSAAVQTNTKPQEFIESFTRVLFTAARCCNRVHGWALFLLSEKVVVVANVNRAEMDQAFKLGNRVDFTTRRRRSKVPTGTEY
jgi:hypothetical protein